MVVNYEGGTKSLPMFWFVSGFLSTSCGLRGRCVCMWGCVCGGAGWGWVWVDGNGCVATEKVTNAGGNACLGKFFFFFSPLCCGTENREEIQTRITPVPLPEKCAPRSLQISSLLWGKGHTKAVGWSLGGCREPHMPPTNPEAWSTWDNTFFSFCMIKTFCFLSKPVLEEYYLILWVS